MEPTSSWGGQLVDRCSAKHCMVCIKFPETWASNRRQRPSSSTRPAAKHRGSFATALCGLHGTGQLTGWIPRLNGIRGGPRGPQACRNIPMAACQSGDKGVKAGGRAEEFAQSNRPTGGQNHQPTAHHHCTTALRSRHLPHCEGLELAIAGAI